ncbi:MAG: glutaredoxin family protein [Nitriliruptoraceae bacterium]|nr:glutaredoxin family protein [Nitriliruptoraceae bacterium]
MTTDHAEQDTITVFWRPGCPFCAGLFRGLERAGLEVERIDIWEDEQGAAFVRGVAGGNETVPTVRIGDLALVNPSSNEVLRTVAEHRPDRLPEGYQPPQPGRLAQAVTRLLGG